MAEKEPVIVIKKVTVTKGGHHGGSWKVAFADFMTAMMAFFLVMWLISSAQEDVKSEVANYFSTPSVVEYYYQTYGARVTLEKLFLDFVDEPLKFFQAFIQPMDASSNLLAMDNKAVVADHLQRQFEELGVRLDVTEHSFRLEMEDPKLFEPASDEPSSTYSEVMSRLQRLVRGLEYAIIYFDSVIYLEGGDGKGESTLQRLAKSRLEMVMNTLDRVVDPQTVEFKGAVVVERSPVPVDSSDFVAGKVIVKVVDEDDRGARPTQSDPNSGQKDLQQKDRRMPDAPPDTREVEAGQSGEHKRKLRKQESGKGSGLRVTPEHRRPSRLEGPKEASKFKRQPSSEIRKPEPSAGGAQKHLAEPPSRFIRKPTSSTGPNGSEGFGEPYMDDYESFVEELVEE